jgi:two-component SAPR family response regulator
LDPWYELGVSQDYIAFESELLWLDADLVRVASASFLSDVIATDASDLSATDAMAVVSQYRGQFCPEFEYEEWATTWRSRVHAAFLDFGHHAIDRLIEAADLTAARDTAVLVLNIDPSAADIERRLIWLYARLGSQSAADTQYRHLAAGFRADGLEPPSFNGLVAPSRPS